MIAWMTVLTAILATAWTWWDHIRTTRRARAVLLRRVVPVEPEPSAMPTGWYSGPTGAHAYSDGERWTAAAVHTSEHGGSHSSAA